MPSAQTYSKYFLSHTCRCDTVFNFTVCR